MSFIAPSIMVSHGIRTSASTLCLRLWSLLLLCLMRLLLRLIPLRKRRLHVPTWVVVALMTWWWMRSHKTSLSKVDTLFHKNGSTNYIFQGFRIKYLNTPNNTVIQPSNKVLCQLSWVVTKSWKRHELIEFMLILNHGQSVLSEVMEFICSLLFPFL